MGSKSSFRSAWSPGPPVDPHIQARPQLQPDKEPAADRQTVGVVAADGDLGLYTLPAFRRVVARTDVELAALFARHRPVAVVIDADLPGLNAAAACSVARSHDAVVLVTLSAAEQAASILKAGCHGVLMKPFAPILFAGRIGRLLRARALQPRRADGAQGLPLTSGTNCACETVTCPRCAEPNAVSFDFASHRRMWFACLACNQAWIGSRQK